MVFHLELHPDILKIKFFVETNDIVENWLIEKLDEQIHVAAAFSVLRVFGISGPTRKVVKQVQPP